MPPAFSVIIPVYNRAHLVGDCLSSILSQTEEDFEIILVDNRSTDDLAGALRGFQDARIRLIQCHTPGVAAARNAGISAAQGRYVSFLDSDDVWRRDVLEQAKIHMEKGVAAVYLRPVKFKHPQTPDWTRFPQGHKAVRTFEDIGGSIPAGVFGTGTMCGVRKDIVSGGEGFDEELSVGEDIDWALRHVDCGPVVLLEDEPRLAYRVHETNTGRDRTAYVSGNLKILRKAQSGTYHLANRQAVRGLVIHLLVESLFVTAKSWGIKAAMSYYPSVLRLAFAWREPRMALFPRQIPALLKIWLEKRREQRPPPT
jgi:glycosyltransferase involved in cell wall biosynthesis